MDIREYINVEPLLFDGGMGTYFSTKSTMVGSGCELANLSQPELIKDIHREYIEAGCKAIKTNTFAVNRIVYQGDEELVRKTIKAGYEIATEAAKDKDVFVFADVGPGPAYGLTEDQDAFEEYKFVVDAFLEEGATNFLFETNANPDGLVQIAEYIKKINKDAFVICTYAVNADGFSRDGIFVDDLFNEISKCEYIDSIGLNCVCGARHMYELIEKTDTDNILLALLPNAGYPIVVNNRTFYDSDPEYYGEQVAELVKLGASIVGGCCGTTPDHIAKVSEALTGIAKASERHVIAKDKNKYEASELRESRFFEKLTRGEKVIAVELDPPADVNLHKFMGGAWQLKGAGVDIITIADCPIARAHMDSSLLSCKIKREIGIDALPHMTCRDRNMNATKALLMGLYAEGIRNVLLITGDPVPTAERDEVESVYQFNSRKLAGYVTGLSKQMLPSPFHLFGALNVNALNFHIQLKLAKDKLEKGMIGFLTQPILTEQAFENLKLARQELKDCYILGGIIPVISERNARFMDSEINGINVDKKIIDLYHDKNREESEKLAVEISKEIANRIDPYVDGYYLMTPFGRTNLISNIIKEIKSE